MKSRAQMILTAALLSLGSAAQADMYLAGGAYATSVDTLVAANDINDSDVAPAIFLGWRPIELLGVEAGYYDLGNFSAPLVDVEAHAFTVAGLVSLELGPIGAYVKGGLASTEIDVNNASDSSTDPFGGVGITIDLMDKLYVYAEALRFTNDADVDVDVIGGGLRFAF